MAVQHDLAVELAGKSPSPGLELTNDSSNAKRIHDVQDHLKMDYKVQFG